MKTASGIFVTGIDTDVGKTLVSAALLLGLAQRGVELEGRLVNPDLLMVNQVFPISNPWERVNPICLRQPLCPLVAGRLEGLGGVMVPLTARLILLDMIVDLELPVLVVACPSLGIINHTLLTIGAMRDRVLKVVGFVFSSPDPAIPHNSELITDLSGVPFLGTLPWQTRNSQGEFSAPEMLAQVQAHLDL